MEYIACNLCGSDDIIVLYQRVDLRVVRCRLCGLSYLNPRLKNSDLRDKYSHDYSAGYIAKEKSKKKRAKKIIKNILQYKRSGNFLDIGCSAGFILNEARERGFEAYGVDISPLGLRHAKEVMKLNVFEGYLEQAGFSDDFFDAITLYNLIEHIPDPTRFLKEIARVAKYNALIEIWTPDIGHWNAKLKRERWKNIFPEHLYYFTKETMQKMLEKSGLVLFKNQFTLKDGLKIYASRRDPSLRSG